MRIATAITVLIIVPSAAQAATDAIKGSEITTLVAGARVEIDTPLGHKLPVQYHADGRLSGTAGELASYLGAQSDSGRWWVSKDRLCHKWSKWFDGELQCLRLKKDGRRIHWENQAGTSGTATIASAPSVAPPAAAKPVRIAQGDGGTATRMRLTPPAAPVAKAAPAASQPPPSPAPTNAYRVTNVAQDDKLNVRDGPSADDDVIGTLQAEQRGIKLSGECRSRWCPITHGGVSGWVNAAFLVPEGPGQSQHRGKDLVSITSRNIPRDAPDAPRTCLTEPARALLDTIETRFGPVRLVSTCRPGARIAGTNRISRHASGNAVDFDAGARKDEIVAWLVANHSAGGTMTYPDMDHIHADIGRHFVSLAGGKRVRTSHRGDGREWPATRMGLSGTQVR